MEITSVQLHYIFVPYVSPVNPYWGWEAPSNGAHAVLVEVETTAGVTGWGETGGRERLAHHRKAADDAVGLDPNRITSNVNRLKELGHTRIAISGLEMAMWDIVGKVLDAPLYQLLGGVVREDVPLCGLMGIKPPDEAAETARYYCEELGFPSIKSKGGRSVEEDADIALAISDVVDAEVGLRVDANQNYDLDDAMKLAGTYRNIGIEYFEQPLSSEDLDESRRLREEADIPVGLNESVQETSSVIDIVRADAADVLVPDLPTAGSITELVGLARVAEASGLPCAFHCWHDLGIKTAAMAHLVAALPAFTRPSDTTYHGLEADILDDPFVIDNGCIQPPRDSGLGVKIDMGRINDFRKSPEEVE
jgi:L-alanine-DL-glutamate epimerase-like enolase superfamily enzyme